VSINISYDMSILASKNDFKSLCFVGLLYDATQSYDYGFYLAGLTIFVSGVMLFALPAIQRKAKAKTGTATQKMNGAASNC
jgi:hypothetical protein